MSDQQNDVAATTGASPGAVALTVDYSNGAQKLFAVIPLTQDTDVLDVLRAAGSIQPGLVFEFNVTLPSDRAGRQKGFIASIDSVKADQTNQKWLLWINDRFVGNELTTNGEFLVGTQVKKGDVLVIKLVAGL
jgi:hypothetical protein